MSDLKPCPFCMSVASYDFQDHFVYVTCDNPHCGCSTGGRASQDLVMNIWNTRPSKDARMAELEGMLKRFIPSNEYYEFEEGEDDDVCLNYGGEFQYDDGSEHMGLEVVELLAKGGE